jgi:hypothetical protein
MGMVSDVSVCVVCGMWLYVRIGEPASAHGTVDNGRCSGWLEPTVSVVNDPIARECEGCNAEPNEQCREGCLSLAI